MESVALVMESDALVYNKTHKTHKTHKKHKTQKNQGIYSGNKNVWEFYTQDTQDTLPPS